MSFTLSLQVWKFAPQSNAVGCDAYGFQAWQDIQLSCEIHNVSPKGGLPTCQPDLGHPTLHKQLSLQCQVHVLSQMINCMSNRVGEGALALCQPDVDHPILDKQHGLQS